MSDSRAPLAPENNNHPPAVMFDYDLQDSIKTGNLDDLKFLLQPEYVDKYFPPGNQQFALKHNKIMRLFSPYGIIVRRDKYGHIVCDLVNTDDVIGTGGFGNIHPIVGTLKYRYFEHPGIKYESSIDSGETRRVAKIVSSTKSYDAFVAITNKERDISLKFPYLNTRSSFFHQSSGDQIGGMSFRYLHGRNIFELHKDDEGNKSLTLHDRFQLCIKLCEALKEVHESGITHRDIKPENIMAVKAGQLWFVKIIDFGLSIYNDNDPDKSTNVGTHQYAPYEAFNFGKQDHASDIFSLGITIASVWRDKYQDKMDDLPLQPFYEERLETKWIIPFELFNDITDLPEELKTDISKFLQRMTLKDQAARPGIDECITVFKDFYQRYQQTLPLTNALVLARTAAAQLKTVLQSYSQQEACDTTALAMRADIFKILRGLPKEPAAYQEFVRLVGLKCAAKSQNPEMLEAAIYFIIDRFLTAFRALERMKTDLTNLLDLLTCVESTDDGKILLDLTAEVNNLALFTTKMKKTALDLDLMQEATTHMGNKFLKLSRVKRCFNEIYHLKMADTFCQESRVSSHI